MKGCDDVASDAERLARFEREAKVLAALDYTNIAGIDGLHEVGGVRFLAMELVQVPLLRSDGDRGAFRLSVGTPPSSATAGI